MNILLKLWKKIVLGEKSTPVQGEMIIIAKDIFDQEINKRLNYRC